MLAPILLSNFLYLTSVQSLGHIVGIISEKNPTIVSVIVIVLYSLYGDQFIPTRDFSDWLRRPVALDVISYHFKYLYYKFYENKCTSNQISSVFYKYQIVSDDFNKSLNILIFSLIIYRVFTFLLLKFKVTKDLIYLKLNDLIARIKLSC